MRVRHALAALFLLIGSALPTRAQRIPPEEWGDQLGAPTSGGRALLETGTGLGRPGASRAQSETVPSPIRAETPSEALAPAQVPPTEPGRDSVPTPRRAGLAGYPAELELRLTGPMGPVMRSVLSTDLAYVGEVRLQVRGRFRIVGAGNWSGHGATVELRLVDSQRRSHADMHRHYDGAAAGVAHFLHEFADDVVESLTGTRSAFASRLLFSRRTAPGHKAVYIVDSDGGNLQMVSSGRGIATLPNFGPQRIWYSIATPRQTYITHTGTGERPIVGGAGTHMGATVCGGRLIFASTRSGSSDIWTATLDGEGTRQLTSHPAIEVSPTCASGGRIAFVSDRTGLPQIFIMSAEGGRVQQLTHHASGAQTPSLCEAGERRLLAFTAAREQMQVVVKDLRTGAAHQVSPPGGIHKDPALSPDCRMLAWAAPEGLVVASVDGRHRRLLSRGHSETVRWGP